MVDQPVGNDKSILAEQSPIDAIALEVFSNRLLAIAEEMGRRLVRSSFSPNIKERRDCSTALFTADGRLIAQAAHIPIHPYLSGTPYA